MSSSYDGWINISHIKLEEKFLAAGDIIPGEERAKAFNDVHYLALAEYTESRKYIIYLRSKSHNLKSKKSRKSIEGDIKSAKEDLSGFADFISRMPPAPLS